MTYTPDSLREWARADIMQVPDSVMLAHADAWEADIDAKNKSLIGVNAVVADNAALREKLASAKRILISEGWDAHKLDDAIDARAWPYGAPSESET